MKTVKFGGSSVADAAQIKKVAEIVRSDPDRRIVVVSAPGKRHKADTKVTDLLIALAEAVLAGRGVEAVLAAVTGRYAEIARDLNLPDSVAAEVEAGLRARIADRGPNDVQFMDAMKAAGEDCNARLIAEAFCALGMDARYVNPGEAGLLLSDDFGNAQVLPESYEKLAALRDFDGITVFPGFFGYTRSGEVATFPRGGSDITGAILAAAVQAEVYENFTDVDSVCSMDPRIIENPPPITCMTYREMRELSYAGFGVFHDEAIVPAVRAGIPICIKNTNNPAASGTLVVPVRAPEERTVVGISSAPGFSAVYIDKYMMNREIGFGRRLLQMLEEETVSYEHTPSGIDNISVILETAQLGGGRETRITERINRELQPDAVLVEHGLALIMVVGEGMHYTPGMAAQAAQALAEAGVNIEMINQGASEISMMFAVKESDREQALRALGKAFFDL